LLEKILKQGKPSGWGISIIFKCVWFYTPKFTASIF